VDIEDDVLILTCKYDRDLWIEITPDHELFISGEHIYLTRYQRRLVGDYYDHFMEIMEQAIEIGGDTITPEDKDRLTQAIERVSQ